MSKLEKRVKIITYIYQYEFLKKQLNSDLAFESGDFSKQEIKIIDAISLKYDKFKSLIVKFLKTTWKWERINFLERAILIYGVFEMTFQDYPLVINEMVLVTKAFIPGDAYKLVNAILEKVGLYYEKVKKSN